MGIPVVGKAFKKVFGTRNERMVKHYLRIVDEVSAQEPSVRVMTDAQLLAKTDEFRKQISDGASPQSMIPEVFAVAREAMDRNVGIRNIFNPIHGFDPSALASDARAAFDGVVAEIAASQPKAPEGRLLGNSSAVDPWLWVDIPNVVYDAVRELYPESKPPFRARPFDVQIIGAIVLYEGRIAEMKTGEGKTIVAPLACYLNAIQDHQVHVVTVNDYLVQRDRDWTFPFFYSLGLTVGAIHPMHMQPHEMKKSAYDCDVLYGTTSEFGFDYLRDNMKLSVEEQYQKKRNMAIVDEVDSTLIDEARTPLIISGPAHDHQPRYDLADRLARFLLEKQKPWEALDLKVQECMVKVSGLEGDIRTARDKEGLPAMRESLNQARKELLKLEEDRDKFTQYYEVELDKKRAHLTHDGISESQREANIGSFYVGENVDVPHLLEQAIRAHTVYQRDRDYIVAADQDGTASIVIVDQNTGRKMVGRQWSDGLHQAIESKESVPIKQETQTMATITIQNFYKLYDKLAGMTGTADTEATEFYEIYKLDVVVIPTNVPVIREDRNDLIFMTAKDKLNAIVDEVKSFHDAGRPVLVGTTSVERSKELSESLSRRFNIPHEVLNAEQHDRESEIITNAGQLGAVMIATNMAGRGTDIKLTSLTNEAIIEHWKRRGICPKGVTAEQPEEEVISQVYRHMAPKELGMKKAQVDAMEDRDIRLALLRHWYDEYCWMARGKSSGKSESELVNSLDESGNCLMQNLRFFNSIEDLGGLHVIGTERHESRRIDNQLRGRSGRQGDKGSTRFYLSLEDDLMKMFAGPTTLKILSRLGMKEGDAIEHAMLDKAVGRAQRKVEERNFLIRKNILEYDEVMDLQRHSFYGLRQRILVGHDIKGLIFENIDESMADAAYRFLDKLYGPKCIAEWVRENLGVQIGAERLRETDLVDLHKRIKTDAKEDSGNIIRVTIGEYLSEEIDLGKGTLAHESSEQCDYKGLCDWANSTFKSNLKISQIKQMSKEEIVTAIHSAAETLIDAADLSPVDKYSSKSYGSTELGKWLDSKMGIQIDVEEYALMEDRDKAIDQLSDKAREAYQNRELTYPIDFALDMTTSALQNEQPGAIEQLCRWVNARYELDWDPSNLPSDRPAELRELLVEQAQGWQNGKVDSRAQRTLKTVGNDVDALDKWFQKEMFASLTDDERVDAEQDIMEATRAKMLTVMRAELSQFERWILLQILDQSWKEHLYQMDQLRESIGFRSFSQRDPRIEFKREGSRLFDEMHESVRDKLTGLIFKAKLQPQLAPPQGRQQQASPSQQDPAPEAMQTGRGQQAAPPAPASSATAAAVAATAAARGTKQQQRDLEAANQAGGAAKKKQQPVRAAVTVGRNEPCPCGSGQKYKKCCGARNG